ncbi:hypothetical protein [Streptomyces sp. NPDC021212]|uniref:hypothetical protein n=1 Tax=Streptomyces sp. NPDC021212 TaxID=3365118 RepID=UPI003797859D
MAVAALRGGIRASSLDARPGVRCEPRGPRHPADDRPWRLGALRERLGGSDAGWQDAYDDYSGTIPLALALEGSLAALPGPDAASAEPAGRPELPCRIRQAGQAPEEARATMAPFRTG